MLACEVAVALLLALDASVHIAGAIARNERFRLNVEGRWAYFMYAGSTALMLGLSGGADLFSW